VNQKLLNPLITKCDEAGGQGNGPLKPNVTERNDEVILGPKFLHYTLERFDDLFKYLDKAIGQNTFKNFHASQDHQVF
jgi:hypothetical protein